MPARKRTLEYGTRYRGSGEPAKWTAPPSGFLEEGGSGREGAPLPRLPLPVERFHARPDPGGGRRPFDALRPLRAGGRDHRGGAGAGHGAGAPAAPAADPAPARG